MRKKIIRGFDNFINEAVTMEVPKSIRELTSARMNKLIEDTGDEFGIISASLPDDWADETIKRLDKIEQELLKMKCSYIEITGGYNQTDNKKGGQNSEGLRVDQRLLFITEISFSELVELAKEHSLLTVIWGNKNKVSVFSTATRTATMTLTASDRQIGWVTLLCRPETNK